MKHLIILFFLLLYTVGASAQDFYYVTVMRGMIRKEDRSVLKMCDKILLDEKLIFSDRNCRLVLLHPRHGRLVW